eukprot:gnl/TRDRNA2_/TRDRNA2_177484_c1_seq1.p2 gnl/TRDRNA2_/TRDRNA2_177484_c1~~gnl/TRDRNA2_/TRDRNA2_177484_c1_seq1.p2  ORF type:complete len:198 (-),score=4.82 gnl/TRDRNA2_/TRDRNA2_177484_c1_seq1:83-676(-)
MMKKLMANFILNAFFFDPAGMCLTDIKSVSDQIEIKNKENLSKIYNSKKKQIYCNGKLIEEEQQIHDLGIGSRTTIIQTVNTNLKNLRTLFEMKIRNTTWLVNKMSSGISTSQKLDLSKIQISEQKLQRTQFNLRKLSQIIMKEQEVINQSIDAIVDELLTYKSNVEKIFLRIHTHARQHQSEEEIVTSAYLLNYIT